MTSGYISGETQGKLREFNVSDDSIGAAKAVLSAVREEAIGNPQLIRPDRAFIVMKYTSGDENDNAFKYGIAPALEKWKFEAFKATDDPSMGILSEKVTSGIDESRIVIIKIDEHNPNVYLELGYALGRKKKIYLICRNTAIPTIPTDIKGWEVISYPESQFDILKETFSRYLERDFYLRK